MQGTRKALKWLLVGLMVCLMSTSISKAIYYDITFTYSTERKESEKSFTPPKEPVSGNLSPDILEYPPYLQRFRGRVPINGVQVSNDQSKIYFDYSSYGIACYFPENNSLKTLSFDDSISETSDDNTISDLALDINQSKLYVGAWTGLIIVDLLDWSFEKRNFSDGFFVNEIRCLHYDEQDQMLFIGTDNGLRVFFTNNQTFLDTAKLPSQLHSSLPVIIPKDIAYDSDANLLYIANYDSLIEYNFTSGVLSTLYSLVHTLNSLALDTANNRMFLGSNGLIIFNLKNNQEIAHYGAHPNPMYDYDTPYLIFEPRFGGMVFGSNNRDDGTFLVNTTAEIIIYLNKTTDLLDDYVSSFAFFMDNSTGIPKDYMLIACKGGFSYYDYTTNTITKSLLLDKDIPRSSVSHLSLNSELNQLYIGSFDEYLSVLNLNTTTNTANYDYTNELPEAHIGHVQYYSKNNTLFIATGEGLVLFNLTNNKTIRIFTTNDGLLYNYIQTILLDESSANLFIATINGFNILNLNTLEITQYFPGLNCYSLKRDNAGQKLYIGTDSYLKILSLSTMVFNSITLPETSRNCYDIQIYEAKQIAFLPTQNGLYIFDLIEETFISHYTTSNSPLMTNSLNSGIIFDDKTQTLFIHSSGLVVFNVEHDFWFNLNDARMEEEGLFFMSGYDITYFDKRLFIGSSYGLFIIDHRDEDLDEVFDCYEVWLFGTDPTMNDTDCDGFTDSVELWAGTDPLDPTSFPVPPTEPINLRYLWLLTILAIPLVIIVIYVTQKKQRK